jgi:hypothetical protein
MKTQMINVLKMPSKRTDDSTGSNGNARYEEGTSSVKKVCVWSMKDVGRPFNW